MARRDDGEFLAFATATRSQLRRTAYLLCGDWDRAADLTQEVLIRLYVAWPRLAHGDGLRGYARKAVVSAAIDQGRRRASRELVGLPADQPHPEVGDPAGGVVERIVLMDALAELPPRQRACVVLRYYEDLSVEDVADLLSCQVGTVKSQTARGLAALRAAYTRRGGDLALPEDADGADAAAAATTPEPTEATP